MRDAGDLAISWWEDGAKYGIKKEALEEGLSSGKRIVVDTAIQSKEQIDACLANYGQLHEVYCLLISADEKAFQQRLLTKAHEPQGAHVIKIKNIGSLEDTSRLLLSALRGRLKYSLWLLPSSSHPVYDNIIAAMNIFADGGPHSISPGLPQPPPPFAPHLTLCPAFTATPQQAYDILSAVGRNVPCQELHFQGISTDDFQFFRSFVLEVKLSEELKNAHLTALQLCSSVGAGNDDTAMASKSLSYAPHVSLRYGALGPVDRSIVEHCHDREIISPYRVLSSTRLLSAAIPSRQAALVITTGEDYNCWTEVARVDLCAPLSMHESNGK